MCLFGVHQFGQNGSDDGSIQQIFKMFPVDVAQKDRNLLTVHQISKTALADVVANGTILFKP